MTPQRPCVMMIAGEASGDQYGAFVLRELRARIPDVEVFGIGGDRMAAEGMELLFHTSQTAIMGFVEVVKHAALVRDMFRRCTAALHARKPSAVLLIDYPGFNLKFARRVRAAGGKVLYYISPQVWAWGKGRAEKLRDLVDHLAVVFPFEEDLFRAIDVPVSFVGHPLLEILPQLPRADFLAAHGLPDTTLLGLFPGSRRQEVERLLPPMIEAARRVSREVDCLPVIGAAGLPDELYHRFMPGDCPVRLLRGATHGLMQHSHTAIVASGTATVETAYYGTPMVIVYRTSFLNYEIGKRLINIDTIGMANILAGKRIVPELLQGDVTPQYISEYVLKLMHDTAYRERTIQELHAVKQRMGTAGASARVAEKLISMM